MSQFYKLREDISTLIEHHTGIVLDYDGVDDFMRELFNLFPNEMFDDCHWLRALPYEWDEVPRAKRK